MNTSYNKTRKKVNEYEKLSSQTRGGYAAYDKGESGLLTTKNQTKASTPPLRKNDNYPNDSLFGLGALAKSKLNSALRELYPDNRYKGLFDGIDDKAVEKNLTLADDVIAKNSANPYNKALFPKLPNLRGGLATYYAAAEAGKYKAANMARKLAYMETTEQSLPDVAKTAKTQTSNKRYVNADIGLNVRESPGTESRKIGSLGYNQEVEFTGKKVGENLDNMWAEIKYGDKTGWVAAKYLNLERPYVLDGSNMQKSFEKDKIATQATPESQKDSGATRYIGKNEMFLYESPNMKSNIIMAGHWGDEVIFTGEKRRVTASNGQR